MSRIRNPAPADAIRARVQRSTLLRAAAALLTGGLLGLAFAPYECAALAWIALAPLMLSTHGLGSARATALGALAGFVFCLFGVWAWIGDVPGLRWTQAVALGIWFSMPIVLWSALLPRLQRSRVPLVWAAPALWVSLDFLHGHAGFLALPWATLAQSQHANLALLQLASIGGEYAVTFVVALGSAALAQFLRGHATRHAVGAVAGIVVVHAAGALVLWLSVSQPTLRVAAIQPDIRLDERESSAGRAAIWKRLNDLTARAAAQGATLVVWPETAIQDLGHTPASSAALLDLAQRTGATLVVGAAQYEKFSAPRAGAPADAGDVTFATHVYNAAYLVSPGEPIGPAYRKRRLMPFAEYVPLEEYIAWPQWLARPVQRVEAGDAPQILALRDGTRIGASICWENLFSEPARDEVLRGARLLVQLTNDVWFGASAASRQHNSASVLRAVENRVPVVIASNTGPSQVIDAYGRVVGNQGAPRGEDVAQAQLSLASTPAPYTRTGDLWIVAIAALAVAAAALPRRSAIRTPQATRRFPVCLSLPPSRRTSS